MRTIWVIVVAVFMTITLATMGLIIGLFERKGRTLSWVASVWSKAAMKAAGLPYSITGLENLDPKGNYIFAGNHESAFDIPLAFAALPYRMVSISKKELGRVPIFGWAMAVGKHIFVDRSNHIKALESLKIAEKSLIDNPRSILLFPEGTRSLDGQIKAFKHGGLVLGINCNMPVVPIALCGTGDVNLKGSWKLTPRKVEIIVGKPILTNDITYEDRADLAKRLRNEVVKLKDSWIDKEKT